MNTKHFFLFFFCFRHNVNLTFIIISKHSFQFIMYNYLTRKNCRLYPEIWKLFFFFFGCVCGGGGEEGLKIRIWEQAWVGKIRGGHQVALIRLYHQGLRARSTHPSRHTERGVSGKQATLFIPFDQSGPRTCSVTPVRPKSCWIESGEKFNVTAAASRHSF